MVRTLRVELRGKLKTLIRSKSERKHVRKYPHGHRRQHSFWLRGGSLQAYIVWMNQNDRSAQKANLAGGSAAAGGMNFQAAVTALIGVSMLRGQTIPWLSGFIDDAPVRVCAETSGPGDDIAVEFSSGRAIEIQVKQGLRADQRLWNPIRAICKAIRSDNQLRAAIVVSPTSSAPVKHKLPRDIARIAHGRTDSLSEIGAKLLTLLDKEKVDAKAFCQQFRLIIVHAIDGERADVNSAEIALEHLVGDASRARAAWSCVYGESSLIIEQRSARSVAGLVKALERFDLFPGKLSEGTAAKCLLKINEITRTKAEQFTLPAWSKSPINVKTGWMPLLIVRREENEPATTKEDALKVYQNWDEKAGGGRSTGLEPLSVGQFYQHCVVVGGPGMGKSTYLRRLALHYADEGFPTLRINLRVVAARIKSRGTGFAEALFELGVDGSGLSVGQVVGSAFDDWVLLCDGLDECGMHQEEIAAELAALAKRHPRYRIIVTTRPVGYDTALLCEWRHYEIVPFSGDFAGGLIVDLISEMPELSDEVRSCARQAFLGRPYSDPLLKAIGRSPLILALMAVVFAENGTIPPSLSALYKEALSLFEKNPLKREVADLPSKATLKSCLSLLAYAWVAGPVSSEEELTTSVVQQLSERLGATELVAAGTFEKALEYWEETGLIERLHFRGERLVSFIHKGFAEFLAAKEILARTQNSGGAIDLAVFGNEVWLEALRHLSVLADKNVIANALVASKQFPAKLLSLALEAEDQTDRKLDDHLLKNLLDGAFGTIGGPNRIEAQSIAEKLLPVASRYPKEVIARASALKSADQPWVRLNAWALLTADGVHSSYEQPELEAAFVLLLSELKPAGSWSKFGGLRLGGSGWSLAQSFAKAAIESLLARSDQAFCDQWIPKVVSLDFMGTTDMISWRNKLAEASGKAYLEYVRPDGLDISSSLRDEMLRFTPDERHFNEILFGALEKLSCKGGTEAAEPLILVGAFCEAIGYWERPGFDNHRWRDFSDFDDLETVLTSALSVLSIDKNRLGQEAKFILHAMRRASDDDFFRVSFMIPFVDAPEPDWDQLRASKQDFTRLEAIVHHPSEWYAILAARILDSNVTIEERRGLVQRILRDGRSEALWFGAALGEALDKEEITALIIDRVHGESVPGGHHLFRALKECVNVVEAAVIDALRVGLTDKYVRTAQSASELADQLLDQASDQLLPLIDQAYSFWVEHEPKMDPDSNIVPSSPRETLLKTRLRYWVPTEDEIYELCADERSDVSKIGDDLFLARFKSEKTFRGDVVGAVVSGSLGSNFLHKILADNVLLTCDQRMEICGLTRSEDDSNRFRAMDALMHPDVDAEFARAELARLEKDEVQEIRDKANRLLFSEKFSTNPFGEALSK